VLRLSRHAQHNHRSNKLHVIKCVELVIDELYKTFIYVVFQDSICVELNTLKSSSKKFHPFFFEFKRIK
jgi:hypothetical protein